MRTKTPAAKISTDTHNNNITNSNKYASQANFRLKKFFTGDFIVYYWALLFIAPIVYLLQSDINEILIGSFVCIWVAVFFGYLLLNWRVVLDTDKVYFSQPALYVFFATVLLSFIYSTVSKYYAFFVPARDAAIFNSMLQEMLLGNFGFSSVVGFYHFATHQNYILALLLPIYAIFPSQVTLQIIAAIIIWLAGVMLWKISCRYLNHLTSLIAVVVFYLSPSNHFYFFRPELFFPLCIFLIYYAYMTKANWKYVILACLFLLAIKEDAPLYMPGFILLFALDRRCQLAAILAIITVSVIILNLEIVQPYFVLKGHQQQAETLAYWAQWGHSNKQILINIVTHPYKIVSLLFDTNSGFWYVYGYWLFIPLANLFVLAASTLPMLLFTTSDAGKHALIEYYPNALSAIALLGIIIIFYKLTLKFAPFKRFFNIWLLFLLLIHNVLYVRVPFLLNLNYSQMNSDEMKYVFISCPIYKGRWQEFFQVNYDDIHNFNDMYLVLKSQYKDNYLCLENQIYPHVSNLDFDKVKPFIWGKLKQDNCVSVFATVGDQWPNSWQENTQQMQDMLNTLPCQKFGNFYICNNLKGL